MYQKLIFIVFVIIFLSGCSFENPDIKKKNSNEVVSIDEIDKNTIDFSQSDPCVDSSQCSGGYCSAQDENASSGFCVKREGLDLGCGNFEVINGKAVEFCVDN